MECSLFIAVKVPTAQHLKSARWKKTTGTGMFKRNLNPMFPKLNSNRNKVFVAKNSAFSVLKLDKSSVLKRLGERHSRRRRLGW
ncbi:hypothetical protein DFR28_102150 [Arenicella xantha]|uniref:Uncharacterized protein n=1 Tax=Arenicella xantha TaxID=644221 RepID=A0A395JM48_9GAMM|nr:hypothetical protein DFR28_102150 [Arenicella xantha]